MFQWISVNKELPDHDVLVYTPVFNCYDVAHWVEGWGEWRTNDDEPLEGVTYWAEIPPLPQKT